jgi:glycosyl hydrolase family 115 (putative glucuronidase)
MQRALFLALLLGTLDDGRVGAPIPSRAPLTIDATTAIVVGVDQPAAVKTAVKDLAADMEKVFGRAPRIVSRREDAPGTAIVVTTRTSGDAESFAISASRPSVQLAGTGRRGTIYAIYQFSEDFLGVDPLYFWTDHAPARKAKIDVPDGLQQDFPAPVFTYRGFFINDEDLLTGWAPGEAQDHTGIALATWDRIYETILRLKGNTVAPGTWIFSDEPQIAAAGARGLIVTQHHAIPLGMNVARWPEDAPYTYGVHPDVLQRAWTNAVAGYPHDQEILWTVGLRGLSDSPYSAFDTTVANDNHALGRVIGQAMAEQVRIVRAAHPDASFITNLWQEGARLVQSGDLQIPEGVHAVWADDGYGTVLDNGRVKAGDGMYYHVAMMNGRANQLTEMVPVERIYSEFGRYIAAGATHYMLVNVSDIRPVPMTTRALMDAAWKGVPKEGASAGASAFYKQWAGDQFGTGAAAAVAAVYEEYFKAPPRTTVNNVTREYGDQLYHTEARRMLLTDLLDRPLYNVASQAPPWMALRRIEPVPPGGPWAPKEWLNNTLKAELAACPEAQPRWDAVWEQARAAERLVAPDRRPFYQAHVLTAIAINRQSNLMLLDIARAIQARRAGRPAEAKPLIAQALRALDDIRAAETAAEYGQWKNWYAGDWLTNVPRTRQTVQAYADHLNDSLAPLPSPLQWDWEAYYRIMHYEGGRTVNVR